tara:strand:+ start:164 stop:451 length:288 start_codon:yes stop_codon:yes gene_type:complete
MALGLGEIITVAKLATEVIGDRKQRGGSGISIDDYDFDIEKRPMQELDEPGEVKASEAVSYKELNRIWDSILPNAYAEIIKTPEQPAFASRREIT